MRFRSLIYVSGLILEVYGMEAGPSTVKHWENDNTVTDKGGLNSLKLSLYFH